MFVVCDPSIVVTGVVWWTGFDEFAIALYLTLLCDHYTVLILSTQIHRYRLKLVMTNTLWQSYILFDLRINCLHESPVQREIHAMLILTTSFGGMFETMAGVEQYYCQSTSRNLKLDSYFFNSHMYTHTPENNTHIHQQNEWSGVKLPNQRRHYS